MGIEDVRTAPWKNADVERFIGSQAGRWPERRALRGHWRLFAKPE
jgi:hypothetical protein